MQSGSGDDRIGRFWVAGADDGVSGVFRSRDRGAPRIELQGDLTPAWHVVEEGGTAEDGFWQSLGPADEGPREEALIVHGEFASSPREITLVDCFTYHRRFQLFGGGVSEHFLQARYALIGGFLERDDLAFDAVRLDIESLADWASFTGFRVSGQFSGERFSVEYEMPTIPSARLATGALVRIVPDVHAPTSVKSSGVAIQRNVFVEISEGPTLTWQQIDRTYIRPLISYLQLCTRTRANVVRVWVQANGHWMSLLASHVGGGSETAGSTGRVGLALPDVGIESLGEWLDCVVDTGPIPSVVSDNVVGRTSSLETQLLELATVSEGLHRAIFPQRDRLEPDEAARVKSNVRAAVGAESSRTQSIVEGRFAYIEEMSYPHRLRDLAAEAELAIPGITGKSNRWANAVSDARNEFAHGKKVDFDSTTVDRIAGIVASLHWVLSTVLLLNSHVPVSSITERLGAGQPYAQFRSEVEVLMPAVYRD